MTDSEEFQRAIDEAMKIGRKLPMHEVEIVLEVAKREWGSPPSKRPWDLHGVMTVETPTQMAKAWVEGDWS